MGNGISHAYVTISSTFFFFYLFQCDCDESSQGSSELDFSVFDTDIVQIAAYNNEGYYRINDVLGGGKEIIQAVTKSSEIAIEVREVRYNANLFR